MQHAHEYAHIDSEPLVGSGEALDVPTSSLQQQIAAIDSVVTDSYTADYDSREELVEPIAHYRILRNKREMQQQENQPLTLLVHRVRQAIHDANTKGKYTIDKEEMLRLGAATTEASCDAGLLDELVGELHEFGRLDALDNEGEHKDWMQLIEQAPRQVLRDLYRRRGSYLRRYLTQTPENRDEAASMLRIFDRAYEADWGSKELTYNKIRTIISDSTDFEIAKIPSFSDDESNLYNSEVRAAVRDVCARIGLSPTTAHMYLQNATIRQSGWRGNGTTQAGVLNGPLIREHMQRFTEMTRQIDPSTIEEVLDEYRIETLEPYTTETIDMLDKLRHQDKETIEYLQDGDASVVFFDANGDHNGAFAMSVAKLRKSSGRTILLEIGDTEDILQRMRWLKLIGVRPSTVFIGMHGLPGATRLGRGLDQKLVMSPVKSWMSYTTNVPTMPLARLELGTIMSDEYTQPLREGTRSKGRKELIILSCSSDKQDDLFHYSYAEAVARDIGSSAVDITAASDVAWFGVGTKDGRMYLKDFDTDAPWYRDRRKGSNMVRLRYRTGRDGRGKVRRRLHVPAYKINKHEDDEVVNHE